MSQWLNQSPVFQAEVGARRAEVWNGASDRLRSLLPAALEVIARELQNGSVSAALGVLKAAGLHGLGPPPGPATVEDAAVEARERQADRDDRRFASMFR